jgi:hypothetical protein
VVAGRLTNEANDYYKITVTAGQRLSFEILGHRLGSPIDPQLYLYDLKTQRELAHDNDSPGAQTDPRLSYTFKEAGEYLIEVGDVLNRGGPDFGYRLRIGDFPLATTPVPMAAARGSKVTVRFAGPAVEGVAPVEVAVPADPLVQTVWLAPKGPGGLHGWPVALAVSDHPELVEQEPNNEPAKANRVAVPGGITGRFEQPSDTDFFVFAGKKGQRLVLQAHTLEQHSPSLVYMTVRDAKGKGELAKTNPQAVPPADQRIDFTPPADGDYLVEVQHLNLVGGPAESYHLTVTPGQPGFALSLGLDRFDVAAGSVLPLVLQAARQGYAGPIEVSVTGTPGLKGQAVIAAGQPLGTLLLEAEPTLKPGPYLVTLTGKAVIDGKPVTVPVRVGKAVRDSLAGLPYPPRPLLTQVAVAVREKAPFQLLARVEPSPAVPGLPANLIVTATRDPGFADEIGLGPVEGLPPNAKPPALKPIPKGQSEFRTPLDLNPKVPLGSFTLTVSGKGKHQNKDFVTTSRPAALTLTQPFELKVEAVPLSLPPGSKAKLKVTAVRHGGYDGPIALDLRNLPAKVTAAKMTLAKGQSAAEIEVTAAADAPAAARADVNVLGTAAALGNRQAASPNFTVSVAKK